MSIFSLFSSKINDKNEVYNLVKSINKDNNISIIGRGTIVRKISKKDRERLNNLAEKYAKKYINKKK